MSMWAGSGQCAAVVSPLNFTSQALRLTQSSVPLHSRRHTSYDEAGFKCLSSEASGSSSDSTHSGSSEDVTAGGGGGGCCFGVSPVHPSVKNKALLADPLGPASAMPAIVSRALHRTQPLNGIVNPFEVAAHAGYDMDIARLDALPFSGISRAVQHSGAAWGDKADPAAAQLSSTCAATAGLLPAPGSTVGVVRSGANGPQRGAVAAKPAPVMPQSPFAAFPSPRMPGYAPITSTDSAQSRPSTDVDTASSHPGASAAGTADTREPAQLAGSRTSSHADPIVDAELHPADTPEQATPFSEQQQVKLPRRGSQPPRNPFADVRGACSLADSSAAGVVRSATQQKQPAAAGDLPALGDGQPDWAWPVHRADEALPTGASGGPLPVDSPFGAVGSGAAIAAQRRGAHCCAIPCLSSLLQVKPKP